MIDLLRKYLSAPLFEDADKNRTAILIQAMSAALIVLVLLSYIVPRLIGIHTGPNFYGVIAFFGVILVIQVLLRTGRITASSLLLVAFGWILATAMIYNRGSISHPLIVLYTLIIMFGGLLLGSWAAYTLAGLTALATLAFAIMEQIGMLTPTSISLIGVWILLGALFGLTSIIVSLGNANLRNVQEQGFSNRTELERSRQSLEQVRATLEQRVVERTTELEQRNLLLETSSEIARISGTILEIEALMRTVVELIRERFKLYYVGIFLVDAANEYARLQAGTGEAGRSMLARGHQIKIGEGMIGWSIAHRQARLTLYAEKDPVRMATEELPDTRSEAALPLRSRGRVIGALSAQSNYPDAFDEITMDVLQTMADQVAVAIENARLFTENQEALEYARKAYGEISQQAWKEIIAQQNDWGYRFTGQSISTVKGAWKEEMQQAIEQGHPIFNLEHGCLAMPVRIRSEIIGALYFHKRSAASKWTKSEIATLETLLNQIEQALESARLYQETQRRALREQISGQVTARIRETLDIETVLTTAIKELQKNLGLPEVVIRLLTPETMHAAARPEESPRPLAPEQPVPSPETELRA